MSTIPGLPPSLTPEQQQQQAILDAQLKAGMISQRSYNIATNSITNPISPTNPPNPNPQLLNGNGKGCLVTV